MKKLTIIIPAYNESEVLEDTLEVLNELEKKLISIESLDNESDILVVDDGSSDNTWELIEKAHKQNKRIKGVKFSRNFGHQNAVVAGLYIASKTADLMVTIDADLQDDPNAISEMVKKYDEGNDIVYGVRNNRDSDTWFKRTTANAFYKLLNLIGVQLVPNHADFRLMSKRAVETFLQYHEQNIFIRGIIPKLGYKSDKVFYKRAPRELGESKYPLKKMLAFAWDGITSLTIVPVRFILTLGIIAVSLGIIMFIYSIASRFLGSVSHGWSSLMISIWVLGGLQMISLGIIGEYIGKITSEVKKRPRYTIETILE